MYAVLKNVIKTNLIEGGITFTNIIFKTYLETLKCELVLESTDQPNLFKIIYPL